jgi:hypothetical protein
MIPYLFGLTIGTSLGVVLALMVRVIDRPETTSLS